MSLMWRSLTTLAIASSVLIAGDGDVVRFVKHKLARNPQVHVNSVKITDKLPIPGIKGWSAYVMALDINLSRGKERRRIEFEDILFVSKNLITTELVDRKTGRDVRSMIQPKMPADIYDKSHLLYGKADAKHKIIVFSDPLCPFCRMSVPDIMKAAKEHPGDIALYYYHMPLVSLHPASATLVRVMAVAQKEGRKDVVEKMYTLPIDYKLTDEKKILAIVKKQTGYEVDAKKLHAPWVDKLLKHDTKTAKKLLVTGTPTVYADGKKDVTRGRYKSFITKKKK